MKTQFEIRLSTGRLILLAVQTQDLESHSWVSDHPSLLQLGVDFARSAMQAEVDRLEGKSDEPPLDPKR